MRKLTIAALAIAAGTSLAWAQGISSPTPAPGSIGGGATTSSVPSAPVGHRQPRRADVPDAAAPMGPTAEDRALDRKIKSICRGC